MHKCTSKISTDLFNPLWKNVWLDSSLDLQYKVSESMIVHGHLWVQISTTTHTLFVKYQNE